MDPLRVDHLSRALSAHRPRRGVLGLLAAVPIVGGLLGILGGEETEAAGRRKRRKKAHKHGKGRRRKHDKHKKKKPRCTQGESCGPGKICCAGSCASTPWANQTSFGGNGSGASQFSIPFDIALSPDELTAWVADAGNNRISIWTRPSANSTAWTNQTAFGSVGSGSNQLSFPRGVAVSTDTLTAWVADTANSRVSIWTRPSTTSTAWTNQTTFGTNGSGPAQFAQTTSVAVSPDTLTVWVGDFGNNRISVWTRPSASSTTWTNQTTFGSVGSGSSEFNTPTSVAVSPDTLTAWVVDFSNNRVSIWTRPSAGSTAWTNQTTFGSAGSGPSQFNQPVGIAVSADTLAAWVADSMNSRVSIWTRPTTTSTTWTNQTTFSAGTPLGVAVSTSGLTVWVADTAGSDISVWKLVCPA